MILISIDPGVQHCGVVVWMGTELRSAALIQNSHHAPQNALGHRRMASEVLSYVGQFLKEDDGTAVLVLERPQIYQNRRVNANEGDLLDVYGVCCAIVTLVRPSEVYEYTPHDWKGNTPKKIQNTRTIAEISPCETERVQLAGSLSHNIWDGVGIGLYHLRTRGLRRRGEKRAC